MEAAVEVAVGATPVDAVRSGPEVSTSLFSSYFGRWAWGQLVSVAGAEAAAMTAEVMAVFQLLYVAMGSSCGNFEVQKFGPE